MFKPNYRVIFAAALVAVSCPALSDDAMEPVRTSAVYISPLQVEPADPADSAVAEPEVAEQARSVAADEQGMLTELWAIMSGSPEKSTVNPGAHTEGWLTLQRTGAAASANPQAASAVQREKAAERFLKTYDYAIKESYYGDSFKSGNK